MIEVKECVELKELLIQRFQKKNTLKFYRKKLSRMRMDEKETIEEFADRRKTVNSNSYELVHWAGKQEVNAINNIKQKSYVNAMYNCHIGIWSSILCVVIVFAVIIVYMCKKRDTSVSIVNVESKREKRLTRETLLDVESQD